MNLLSSLLAFTARQIAALRSADTATNNRIDETNQAASALTGRVSTNESNIQIMNGRLDTAISAVTTSTEVTDIRVGDDGVTYQTAGTAVRTQLSNLKSELWQTFDESVTYATNDYVTRNNKLYRFKVAHSGAWKSADVDEVVLTSDIAKALTQLNNSIIQQAYVDGYQDGITLETLADHSIVVHFPPTTKFLYKSYGNGRWYSSNLDMTNTPSITVPNNQVLYFDLADTLFHTDTFSNMKYKDSICILFHNAYGMPVGQWSYKHFDAETNAQIDSLEAEFDDKEYINSNRTSNEYGSFNYSTGAESDSDTIIRTGFIPVIGGALYQIYASSGSYNDVRYVFEYNSSKTFIKYTMITQELYESGLTLDENTAFIRTRTATASTAYIPSLDTKVMVEFGKIKTYQFDGYINKNQIVNYDQLNTIDAYPDYYKVYLSNKYDTINALNSASGVIDSFVFMTDYHFTDGTEYCAPIIRDILNYTSARFLAYGGDTITNLPTAKEAIDWFVMFNKRFENVGLMYQAIGNHEWNDPSGTASSARLSEYMVRALNIARYEREMVSSDGLDYRIDNHIRKISYIYLSCGYLAEVTTAQNEWLCNELLQIPNGYSLVVISHDSVSRADEDYLNPNIETAVGAIGALKAKTTFTYNGITYDYSQKNVDVVAVIGGHSHIDAGIVVNGVLVTATTCESARYESGGLTRTLGTVNETAFDVVTINKTTRKLNFTRIGAGSDREFSY